MTPTLFFFTSFIFVVPSVLAHGYVSQVSIDGKAYAGNVPNNGNYYRLQIPVTSRRHYRPQHVTVTLPGAST